MFTYEKAAHMRGLLRFAGTHFKAPYGTFTEPSSQYRDYIAVP
jgi:hypothetical protein